jgi:hypothetical protein
MSKQAIFKAFEEGQSGVEERRARTQAKFCPWLSHSGLKECLGERCAFFQEHFNECALKAITRLVVTRF